MSWEGCADVRGGVRGRPGRGARTSGEGCADVRAGGLDAPGGIRADREARNVECWHL